MLTFNLSKVSFNCNYFKWFVSFWCSWEWIKNLWSRIIPISHRGDCLISNPNEAYEEFSSTNDNYLFELNPCCFKLLFPLRVPINEVQVHRYFITKEHNAPYSSLEWPALRALCSTGINPLPKCHYCFLTQLIVISSSKRLLRRLPRSLVFAIMPSKTNIVFR